MTRPSSTGAAIETQSLSSTGAVTATLKTGYDLWGRAVSTTNVHNETTTTTYDTAGRVEKVTDPKGTTSYGYDTDADGKPERRGMPTTLTVSGVGTFAGAYDAAGNLITQKLPGGITQKTSYDNAGEPTALTYSGQVTTVNDDGTTTTGTGEWLAWSQHSDVTGRVRREWTPQGTAFTDGDAGSADTGDALSYDRNYVYDRAGRLVTVHDRTAPVTGEAAPEDQAESTTACTTRRYTFDKNDNRTGLTTTPAAVDGSCSTATTATSRAWSHDSADRNAIAAGYSYDLLGRTLTIPAVDTPANNGNITLGYYDTDAARTITSNGQTVTYTLDPAGRRLNATTAPAAGGSATRTVVRHYVDGSDNPGWVDETVGTTTTVTRYAESLGGDLSATITGDQAQLSLANLHGDVVTTVTLPAAGAATAIGAWNDYDEYGNPRAGGAADPLKYGWLGAKQRSGDTADSGLLLMGARLYNPTTGRFTSIDPEPEGSPSAYAYPTDPINGFDLDGRRWGWLKRHAGTIGTIAGVAAVFASGPVGWGLAAVAIAGSAYSARQKWRAGNRRGAAWDAAGAVVGVGAAIRAARAARLLRLKRSVHVAHRGYRGASATRRTASVRYARARNSYHRWNRASRGLALATGGHWAYSSRHSARRSVRRHYARYH